MAEKRCDIGEATCSDMKEGEVYFCEDCGFEVKVMKECHECCCDTELNCCGKPMTLRE